MLKAYLMVYLPLCPHVELSGSDIRVKLWQSAQEPLYYMPCSDCCKVCSIQKSSIDDRVPEYRKVNISSLRTVQGVKEAILRMGVKFKKD